MIEMGIAPAERRLLLYAPDDSEAGRITAVLRMNGVQYVACRELVTLAAEFERGAGVLLLTQEAVTQQQPSLAGVIAGQAPWSDVPVLVLGTPGADPLRQHQALSWLGNVTLLERPVRAATLLPAVRIALRARERQYAVRAYLAERDEADRRKDEFLAMLAHELRNPLAPIRNSVGILRMAGGEHLAPQLSEMIDRQVDHMVRLVDDLMEISRVTRGRTELHKESLELRSVIEAAVAARRAEIEAAQLELTLTLPQVPMPLSADRARLEQVFGNLLGNAVKFTPPGGRIGIRAQREDASAVVIVSDTGIGIAPRMLERIFEVFVQGDDGRGRKPAGLGIGLALVKSLVELHGGQVGALSDGKGKGSSFIVRLPLALQPPGRHAESLVAAAPEARPRVLVVDDNHDAADTLGVLLQMLGADVQIAHDGAAALALFEQFRPVILFLDLGMGGISGYEVARRIRERADGRDVVLIALTGWGRTEDRERTRDAGFDGHLVKPADIASLQRVLASLPA